MIPKMSFLLSIRSRLQFTTNALPSVILHAERDHEIIIALDKCSIEYEQQRRPDCFQPNTWAEMAASDRVQRERVYRWIDTHKSVLDEHKVRVVESYGDERCWTGGLRSAAALNVAVEASTTDWIVAIGDEDLFFEPKWDRALWTPLEGRDPMRYVSTPVMVMPDYGDSWPDPLTAEWIHRQRNLCCHKLTMPLPPKYADSCGSARLSYETFHRFAQIGAKAGLHEEPCGERRLCHWVPMLMYKPLVKRVGGWKVEDSAAMCYDIRLDDDLARHGVVKVMPLDHMVLHTKYHVKLSDYVDRTWGDAETLAGVGRDVF